MSQISQKITNGIKDINIFLQKIGYRNILIALLIIVVIVLVIRSYHYNNQEGFETEIKALIDYEYKKFDRTTVPIWDNRMYLLQPARVNDQKYSFWSIDKDLYLESSAENPPQKSLGSTMNVVSNSQVPDVETISITGGKFKSYTDYQTIAEVGDDELSDLKIDYSEFQKANPEDISELLNSVKNSKEVSIKLKSYYESIRQIDMDDYTSTLDVFVQQILKTTVIEPMTIDPQIENSQSKSVSLHEIINNSNGVYQAPIANAQIFHNVPFGVTLSIYSKTNFGGTGKSLYVPFDTNEKYKELLKDNTYTIESDSTPQQTLKLIDQSQLNMGPSDADLSIDTPSPITSVTSTREYDGWMAKYIHPQLIESNTPVDIQTNFSKNYSAIVNIYPGGDFITRYTDVNAANIDLSNQIFEDSKSNFSLLKPGTNADDSMSSYGYFVGMKLGLIPVSWRRKSDAMAARSETFSDGPISIPHDSLNSYVQEHFGGSFPLFQTRWDILDNVIDDIIPPYIVSPDPSNDLIIKISNPKIRGYLEKIVTNLAHLPSMVKQFDTPKQGIQPDIPLVTIKPQYYKSKKEINLISKTRNKFINEVDIELFNNTFANINKYLKNEYGGDDDTDNILYDKIDSLSKFNNYPRLLQYYTDEGSRPCKESSGDGFNEDTLRGLYGQAAGAINVSGSDSDIDIRYGSFADLDKERFDCYNASIDTFLFSYEFHPHLANDSIFPSVGSYQIDASSFKNSLEQSLIDEIKGKIDNIINDSSLKNEIREKIQYVDRNLNILTQFETFLEKVNSNNLKFPYIKFIRPIAPPGFVSMGDIVMPSEKSMDTRQLGSTGGTEITGYQTRSEYSTGVAKHGMDYIDKHIRNYVAVPETCTKYVRGWQMTDKIYEINQDGKTISLFQNPFTNTVFATTGNKLPGDGVRKMVACVKKCNAVDNLIRSDQCARNLYKTKKGMESGDSIAPNFADEEENKYYLNKVKQRSSHINSLNNMARKLQLDQDKFNILNQENNRSKLQTYLDLQNKNINILTDKLENDRNKIDFNVHIKPGDVQFDSLVEEGPVRKNTTQQVIKLIQQSTIPSKKKQGLVQKVIKYQSMVESKLMTGDDYKLKVTQILEDCPEYDLSGLVKKDVVSSICYGCDMSD
jgi:hypothetical protein